MPLRPPPFLNGTIAAVHISRGTGPLQALRDAVSEWLRKRAVAAELARLDDRTLADLALTRGDFPAIIQGTFRKGE